MNITERQTLDEQLYDTTRDELETIVDVNGINVVCDMLFEICCAKSEHLRSNWQDDRSAKVWEHIAKQIDAIDRDFILE